MRHAARMISLAALSLASFGCGEHVVTSDDEAGEGEDVWVDDDGGLRIYDSQDVDILFVIDNSGSMGEEQARLAIDFASFIEVLDSPDVGVNYRIGVTTSDNGNPWCPAAETTPESGRLVLSSCKQRLDDFTFGDVDVRDLACNDLCTLGSAELEILPTSTDYDPNPVARPWLERIEGVQNLPAGTSMAEAFKCFAPQGVNGCGFESQLESMYLALARSGDESEANYGFLRDDAILAIVIVTDEVDCSYDKAWADIFAQDGDKVFWSDPSASAPTSAVCWNAGVECVGDPSGYDSCDPINKGIDGELDVSDGDAVLHPLRRYVDRVQSIEDAKQNYRPNQEVVVALIAGVAEDGSLVYAEGDPSFQDAFGVGPGCTDAGGVSAVPPVRMRDFTEAFTPASMFSICGSDYTPAFEAIADSIRSQFRPACHWQCAADTDPQTAILEPDCVIEQRVSGVTETMQECRRGAEGYVIDPVSSEPAMPSDDVDVCYVLRVDPGGLSPDPSDDMSSECLDYHYNLEFDLVRRIGVPAPGGAAVAARCSMDEYPQVTCPDLGIGD